MINNIKYEIKENLDQLDNELIRVIAMLEDGLTTAAIKKLREITDSE